MEVSWNRGTPSHHPFWWDFPLQTIQLLGYPDFRKPPIFWNYTEKNIHQHNSKPSPSASQLPTEDPDKFRILPWRLSPGRPAPWQNIHGSERIRRMTWEIWIWKNIQQKLQRTSLDMQGSMIIDMYIGDYRCINLSISMNTCGKMEVISWSSRFMTWCAVFKSHSASASHSKVGAETLQIRFHSHGGTQKWMIYKGKSQSKMDDN